MSSQPVASSSTAQPAPRTKLVVRRLPPSLPEDIFWKAVSPWITQETCLWRSYVKGSEGHDSRPVFSRAYVLMASPDALVTFHRHFDGHIFKSKTGAEFQAVVEFAPFQKTPFKVKTKVDARQGTIEEDADYKSFIESLNAPATKPALEVSVPPPQPTTTPLLDHLRATGKKSKSKSKKAKKAQSKEAAALAAVSKAAANRVPKDQGGVLMVAGKGRGVTITPAASMEIASGSGQGAGSGTSTPKKKRNKKPKGQGQGGGSSAALSGPSVGSVQGEEGGGQPNVPAGGGKSSAGGQEGGKGKSKAKGGRGGGGGGGGPSRGGSTPGHPRGEGGPGGDGGETRQGQGEGARGKGRGRGGRGRGGGGKAPARVPSEARIDM